MELTVINKKRYDELLAQIKELEMQVAGMCVQMNAMQESNNQLAEIAFDEGKFTQLLMDKVDDVAREAARDAIDVDDIASEVNDRLDIGDAVQRVIERMDLQTGDEVNDRIEDVLSGYDYASKDDVEEMLDERGFVEKEDVNDMIEDRVEDLFHRLIGESLAGHHEHIINIIVNKLTAKEINHATDNHQADNSVQISGTVGQSQASSMLCAGS